MKSPKYNLQKILNFSKYWTKDICLALSHPNHYHPAGTSVDSDKDGTIKIFWFVTL